MAVNQQYCLKWSNHPTNIFDVFHRLRNAEQFVDVTLSSADRRTIKCHKLLLCAGSGYLEEILATNPSKHPTIVLSQIKFTELKLLVDFMYAGEVAVEQNMLPNLLEAARILKIKGLWDSDERRGACNNNIVAKRDSADDDNESEPEISAGITGSFDFILRPKMKGGRDVSAGTEKPKMQPAIPSRKRKPSSDTQGSPYAKNTNGQSLSPKAKSSRVYTPMHGISNDYFLAQSSPLQTSNPLKGQPILNQTEDQHYPSKDETSLSPQDIPVLLSLVQQTNLFPHNLSTSTSLPVVPPPLSVTASNLPQQCRKSSEGEAQESVLEDISKDRQTDADTPLTHDPDMLNQCLSKKLRAKKIKDGNAALEEDISRHFAVVSGSFLPSTSVRRYKKYTEDSLQQALKEIMQGQSINRSSMKYNIPARTLRDWMKRLNIKSVFTNNPPSRDTNVGDSSTSPPPSQGDKSLSLAPRGSTSSQDDASSTTSNENEPLVMDHGDKSREQHGCRQEQSPVAFPGMLNLPGILQKTFQESEDCQAEKMKQGEDTEEAAEVEEIDDDEESLKA